MNHICVVQADNRDNLDYLTLTQQVNKNVCKKLNYDYTFIKIDNTKYGDIYPAAKKIYVVSEFLKTAHYDILVFLDSDAWIQNYKWLDEIITNLINDGGKQGCYSRDPYVIKNTYINSGSFILKINDFTKKLYDDIIHDFENNSQHSHYRNSWPWDQFFISNFIYNNREHFNIFIPTIMNTPLGEVLRHNWWKNKRMYNDLHNLLNNDVRYDSSEPFNFDKNYDDKPFPNEYSSGYEYND